MSCQCHQIGGPFIAEDPDCPSHGREAQRAEKHRDVIMQQLDIALESGDDEETRRAAQNALDYLRSL